MGAIVERWTYLLWEDCLLGGGRTQECTETLIGASVLQKDGESLVGGGLPCGGSGWRCF